MIVFLIFSIWNSPGTVLEQSISLCFLLSERQESSGTVLEQSWNSPLYWFFLGKVHMARALNYNTIIKSGKDPLGLFSRILIGGPGEQILRRLAEH